MLKFWIIVGLCILAECATAGVLESNVERSEVSKESALVVKRSALQRQPCAEKFQRIGTHSACARPADSSTQIEVTSQDKTAIVAAHNRYRSIVSPTATNMLQMSWDEETAMIAAAWAETCTFDHDESKNRDIPGRFSLGQNIGRDYHSWTALIDAWFGEINHFTYGSDKNDFHQVGHYTQGVWAETSKIGCGVASCGGSNFHVCNYAPTGNIVGGIGTPYKSGTSCNDCPGHCADKLCACGDVACENGSVMNRTTCTCSCNHEWLVNKQCQLDCDKVKEPSYCGSHQYQFDRASCDIMENVPHACPRTCEVCPTADFRNTFQVGTISTYMPPHWNANNNCNNSVNGNSSVSNNSSGNTDNSSNSSGNSANGCTSINNDEGPDKDSTSEANAIWSFSASYIIVCTYALTIQLEEFEFQF